MKIQPMVPKCASCNIKRVANVYLVELYFIVLIEVINTQVRRINYIFQTYREKTIVEGRKNFQVFLVISF
jgi:hypothetical protein